MRNPRGVRTPPVAGALRLWRLALAAGAHGQRADNPRSWRLDALWQAACWEQSAREAHRLGQTEGAARDLARAEDVLACARTGGSGRGQ